MSVELLKEVIVSDVSIKKVVYGNYWDCSVKMSVVPLDFCRNFIISYTVYDEDDAIVVNFAYLKNENNLILEQKYKIKESFLIDRDFTPVKCTLYIHDDGEILYKETFDF